MYRGGREGGEGVVQVSVGGGWRRGGGRREVRGGKGGGFGGSAEDQTKNM